MKHLKVFARMANSTVAFEICWHEFPILALGYSYKATSFQTLPSFEQTPPPNTSFFTANTAFVQKQFCVICFAIELPECCLMPPSQQCEKKLTRTKFLLTAYNNSVSEYEEIFSNSSILSCNRLLTKLQVFYNYT